MQSLKHIISMKMKKTTSFLTRLLSSSSSPVAPWPQPPSEFDRFLTSKNYTSAVNLTKALDIAISAQKSITLLPFRHEEAEKDLDATVELLDKCNSAKRNIGAARALVESLEIALHRLEGPREPSRVASARACSELDSCFRKHGMGFRKHGSGFRKLGRPVGPESVAAFVIAMVEVAVLDEVAVTVSAARRLRGSVGSRECQVEVRRRCGELEERMRGLEERVGLLYRELIGVRMALLGSL